MIVMLTLNIINVFFIKKTDGINNTAAVERNDTEEKKLSVHTAQAPIIDRLSNRWY